MKKAKIILSIIIVILAIVFILFYVIKVQDIVLKKIYPKEYEEYVTKYAQENEIDPLLIFSIIKAESNFNTKAMSHAEAKGLMQIRYDTAEEIARNNQIPLEGPEDLYIPETNIRIGTKYLSNLITKYKNELIAMCAYNAGMGNVNNWIEKGIIKPDGTDIENVPYRDTNAYVRKIMRDYNIYKKLYQS